MVHVQTVGWIRVRIGQSSKWPQIHKILANCVDGDSDVLLVLKISNGAATFVVST